MNSQLIGAEYSGQAIHRLQDEIRWLAEAQLDAVETETFVGLTAEETRAYQVRQIRIASPARQIRLLQPAT